MTKRYSFGMELKDEDDCCGCGGCKEEPKVVEAVVPQERYHEYIKRRLREEEDNA